MLRLIKIQTTIFFLLLGISICAQEVELVKTIPFLVEDESVNYFRSDFLRVGVKVKAIRLFKPNGELLTPVVYDDILRGYPAIRLIKDGKFGFINLKGSNKVSPLVYDEIKPFKCGCAFARKGENHYLIDTLGNELLFDYDIDFDKAQIVAYNGLVSFGQREKVVDRYGLENTRFVRHYLIFDFEEGIVKRLEDVTPEHPDWQDDHKCIYGAYHGGNSEFYSRREPIGLVNSKGKIVVPAKEKFRFERVKDFIYFSNIDGTFMLDDNENITQLSDSRILFDGWRRDSLINSFIWIDDTKEGRHGFGIMNKHFQKVTPAIYGIYENRSGVLFKYYDHDENRYGVLDGSGKIILEGDYMGLTIPRGYDIFAMVDSMHFRWFDKKGNRVIPFDFYSRFNAIERRNSSDYKVVAVMLEEDGEFVIYDNVKREFWEGEYDKLRFIDERELIIATHGEKVGLLNFKGDLLIDLTFDLIYEREILRQTKDGIRLMKGLIVKNGDEQWFYNFKGERKFQIDDLPNIYKVSDDYFWVKLKGSWEVYKLKE